MWLAVPHAAPYSGIGGVGEEVKAFSVRTLKCHFVTFFRKVTVCAILPFTRRNFGKREGHWQRLPTNGKRRAVIPSRDRESVTGGSSAARCSGRQIPQRSYDSQAGKGATRRRMMCGEPGVEHRKFEYSASELADLVRSLRQNRRLGALPTSFMRPGLKSAAPAVSIRSGRIGADDCETVTDAPRACAAPGLGRHGRSAAHRIGDRRPGCRRSADSNSRPLCQWRDR